MLTKSLLRAHLCALLAVASALIVNTDLFAQTCNRIYLQTFVDNYLDAMIVGDSSPLPLADHIKYTENTMAIPLGDGLWVGASEIHPTFRIYALDPTSGQAGFYGIVKEWDKPVLLALRLKVEEGKISEIEHIVARRLNDRGLANLGNPRAAFLEPVPTAERVSRAEMVRIANSYFDSIEQDKSSVAPFAHDCTRHENGMQTTTNPAPDTSTFGDSEEEQFRLAMAKIDALGCGPQIDCGILMYITKIWPRRLLIIDEELGLVFTFPMFVHRGDVQEIEIVGVVGVDKVPREHPPFNLQAGEIFKIWGGQIHEIEANGTFLPYGSGSGWE